MGIGIASKNIASRAPRTDVFQPHRPGVRKGAKEKLGGQATAGETGTARFSLDTPEACE